MGPLTWDVLASLIIQIGLPAALKVAEKWGKKDVVTPEEIAELRELGSQTPATQVRNMLLRKGISLEDPRAKELMALVGG